MPPSPDMLMDCLGQWENYAHTTDTPPLVQAALLHYQFEAIHPFLDGNGRVGRLLVTLFLIERNVLSSPLLYLSAFFEATRSEYYEKLLSVSQNSQWNPWLEYFLNGVARMSEDALSRAERINSLLQNWREQVSGQKPKVLFEVIGLLSENPYWTIKKISERLNVAYTTAQRAINVLQESGIVDQTNNAERDRVYCANTILNILNEEPKISFGG